MPRRSPRTAPFIIRRAKLPWGAAVRRGVVAAGCGVAMLSAASPLVAQGWQWPWQSAPQQQPPTPPEPVYRPQAQPAPQPYGSPGPSGWAPRSTPICLQLEKRLVQETQGGDPARNLLPMIEKEIRDLKTQNRKARRALDSANCFDTFLFSKTLRRTKKCVTLWNEAEGTRQRLADLETQRSQLMASSGRSHRDEIIQELARNNCGANYEQEARRSSSNPFSAFWSEEDSGGPGGLGTYNALPYATYRTVCVRMCDGYYFPVSFSTLPNHFERDAEACQSKCAAPAELFYYQNPGGSSDQMVGFRTQTPYTDLKIAYKYRKEYVSGCSCNQAEYLPEGSRPAQSGEAAPGTAPAVSAAAAPLVPPEPQSPDPSEELPWAPQ